MNKHVSLADYSGHFAGLGDPSSNGGVFARTDVLSALNNALDMRKSLGAGSNAALGFADGSALIPQSLETTLQVISFEMKELKLWNSIAKQPAYALFEEFDVLRRYGSDELGWMNEGALPAEDDSEYAREVAQVKFLGTTRSVTHVMQLVRTIDGVDPIIEREDRNGTMQLLRTLETGMFFGDDRVEPLSIKGFFQVVDERAPKNIIDVRGRPITDVTLMDLDNASADRYGRIDRVYMSNRQKNNLSQILQAPKQTFTDRMGATVPMGMVVNEFYGNNSSFALESHQFIRESQEPPQTFSPFAPAAPVVTVVGGAPRARTALEEAQQLDRGFSLAAGTYTYQVHAVNEKGEGLGANTGAIAVDAGDVVELSWPNVVGAAKYRIYRATNGGRLKKLTDVGRGAGATTGFVDLGRWIEGTSMAFAMMEGPSGFAWKQLAPLMKLPLATLDTRTRWAILLYGVLQVYQPLKQFVLINVGDAGITHDVDIPRPLN